MTDANVIQTPQHPVYFGPVIGQLPAFIREHNYQKVFFLVDEHTHLHCLPYVFEHLGFDSCDLIELESGEIHKTINTCKGIWETLKDFEAQKDQLLINLGGGMICDIGGFAAATWKRGMDYIHIPTTLLAQTDAAIGGKTGVDLDHLKNAIGTISFPKAVFIDPVFLQTLDQRQIMSGFAETVKHSLIADSTFFNNLASLSAAEIQRLDPENWYPIIRKSAEIKIRIVTEDPYEKGLRKQLNFGHTIGHAIESNVLSQNPDQLLHGEAIAAGMICESYLSHKLSGLSLSNLEQITIFLLRLYSPVLPAEIDLAGLMPYLVQDKKNRHEKINFTLLNGIGSASTDHFIDPELIEESIRYYINTRLK